MFYSVTFHCMNKHVDKFVILNHFRMKLIQWKLEAKGTWLECLITMTSPKLAALRMTDSSHGWDTSEESHPYFRKNQVLVGFWTMYWCVPLIGCGPRACSLLCQKQNWAATTVLTAIWVCFSHTAFNCSNSSSALVQFDCGIFPKLIQVAPYLLFRHPVSIILSRVAGSWNLSLLTLVKRLGTPWTGRHFLT